jgi:hypothetical protein
MALDNRRPLTDRDPVIDPDPMIDTPRPLGTPYRTPATLVHGYSESSPYWLSSASFSGFPAEATV